MKLPDHIKAMLSGRDLADVEAFEAGATHSIEVSCPQCACLMTVALAVKSRAVVETSRYVPAHQYEGKQPTERVNPDTKLLADAERTGVLAAFEKAIEAVPAAQRPNNARDFFLTWLKRLQLYMVPRQVLMAIQAGYGTKGYLEFWQCNGICAVLEDRNLVAFIPTCLLKPVAVGRGTGAPMQAALVGTAAVERWVKGRFGYVPAGATLFQEAMRQRSPGAFDTVRG